MSPLQTLPGRDYHAPDVFAAERERIFFDQWCCVGRADDLAAAGDYLALDLLGESLLITCDGDGRLHGFYNVCRHRGSRLCDAGAGRMKGAVKCPYHAWAYAFDGRLIGTPNVGKDEIDRESHGLWRVAVDVWQGLVFVHLGQDPPPLRTALENQDDSPLPYERFNLGDLRSAHRSVKDVRANWKVLIENYNECLHCPTVHPELVAVVPAFRKGDVFEKNRSDTGVLLADGGNSFTATGHSDLPLMPGMSEHDAGVLYGCTVFPNMFLDITGTGAIATILWPREPGLTTVQTEYLFHPDAIAAPDFDLTPVVDFTELVADQDYAVCERVQRGVTSRAFTHGVYAEKDGLLDQFNRRYLAVRGPVG